MKDIKFTESDLLLINNQLRLKSVAGCDPTVRHMVDLQGRICDYLEATTDFHRTIAIT